MGRLILSHLYLYLKEWAEKQFERNQFSDNIKRTYCKENNIPLLEIPYWDYDNAENIILKFLEEAA